MRRHLPVFIAVATMAFTACGGSKEPGRAAYLPLDKVQAEYGPLITAGNHPTPDQNGTGERVGLFQDASGAVWGLPLSIAANGEVRACAPAGLRDGKVTDNFPAGSTIIGATNAPTGWRGGTGNLELLLRDSHGTIRSQAVHGAPISGGAVCWAPESTGLKQQLHFFRLVPK